jgi:hypothetical protein
MMRDPVSLARCAEYLGVTRGQVKAAIEAGVVRHGLGEGRVVPADVFKQLVELAVLKACPCCGCRVQEAPPADEVPE